MITIQIRETFFHFLQAADYNTSVISPYLFRKLNRWIIRRIAKKKTVLTRVYFKNISLQQGLWIGRPTYYCSGLGSLPFYSYTVCYWIKSDLSLLYAFIFHLFFINSENDLEEVLTFYTQKNKSATVFLGTKVRSVKKDVHEINASGDSGNYESSRSEFLPWVFFFPFSCTVSLVYV